MYQKILYQTILGLGSSAPNGSWTDALDCLAMTTWKSINQVNYPFQLEPNNTAILNNDRVLRLTYVKLWKDFAKSKAASKNISRDSAKLNQKCEDTLVFKKRNRNLLSFIGIITLNSPNSYPYFSILKSINT